MHFTDPSQYGKCAAVIWLRISANLGMLDVLAHHRAYEMRLMDAQDARKHVLVRKARLDRLQRRAGIAAARQLDRVRLELFYLIGSNQVLLDVEAIADEGFDLFAR